jgi:hypothetical protein
VHVLLVYVQALAADVKQPFLFSSDGAVMCLLECTVAVIVRNAVQWNRMSGSVVCRLTGPVRLSDSVLG